MIMGQVELKFSDKSVFLASTPISLSVGQLVCDTMGFLSFKYLLELQDLLSSVGWHIHWHWWRTWAGKNGESARNAVFGTFLAHSAYSKV